MKQSDLWAGDFYAYVDNRPRGVETPRHAKKVKLISTRRYKPLYADRMRTVANVQFVDPATDEPYTGSIEVRARDIVDWWEDYEDRMNDIRKRENAAQAERDRIEAEKKRERDHFISRLAYKTGIPVGLIKLDYYGQTVNLNVTQLREWMKDATV